MFNKFHMLFYFQTSTDNSGEFHCIMFDLDVLSTLTLYDYSSITILAFDFGISVIANASAEISLTQLYTTVSDASLVYFEFIDKWV